MLATPQRQSAKLPANPSGAGKRVLDARRVMSNQAMKQLLSHVPGKPCTACAAGGAPCPKCAARKQESGPQSIQHELGHGRPLESAVEGRMRPLFGDAISGVRIHTGSTAHRLAGRFDARAFTVGNHVAFGAGEYRPGTLAGDALLAHELAHVAQQRGATPADPGAQALERDADRSAVHALSALWSNARAAAGSIRQNAMPRLRSGLRLARCGRGKHVEGNNFGNWDIDQSVSNGSGAGSPYSSDVHIWFNPNKDSVNCSEIAFVQAVKFVDSAGTPQESRPNFRNRMAASGWELDRLDQRVYGWYGYNNDGTPSGTVVPGSAPSPEKSAELTDTPGWSVGNTVWDFETCAICKSGFHQNNIYACLTWGFDVDADNKLTKHEPAHRDAPSADFTGAVGGWNTQAAGPAAQRNAPGQQSLGPFR